MKTTLKRGMGRSATVNGNGRAVYPPGVRTTMQRYRQPDAVQAGRLGRRSDVVLWTALVAVIVAGGVAGAAYLKTHQFIAAISPKTKVDIAAAKHLDVAIPGQPTTALVIGTDRRKGNQAELTGRSDTLILVRADPQTKSLSMLSFPRDLIVDAQCPGHPDGRDRINAAFSECGTLGAVETVRALTGLPINYFVTVNFRGFNGSRQQPRRGLDRRRPPLSLRSGQLSGRLQDQPLPGYQRLNASNALAYRALPTLRLRHLPQRTPAALPQGAQAADFVAVRASTPCSRS